MPHVLQIQLYKPPPLQSPDIVISHYTNPVMSQSLTAYQHSRLVQFLAERQVKVVNLHPGWMRTVMGGALAAQMTDLSVSPEKSAEDIVAIALDAPNFPDNITYMEHTRKPLPW